MMHVHTEHDPHAHALETNYLSSGKMSSARVKWYM